jgi:uncharacterized protein (TIGR02996 family)
VQEPLIYLRADGPPYRVAMEFVERLGFRLDRTLNRQCLLSRAMAAQESASLDLRVDQWWTAARHGDATDGYDNQLSLLPRSRDAAANETEVWSLFDQVCRRLGHPALLADGGRLLAGWAPGPGRRVFPPDTFGGAQDEDRWAAYALPPVREPAGPAADDVLGQLYARILADPDGDAPRLAYADAVETGHPDYAELIRLQVEDTGRRRAGVAPDPVRRRQIGELERALGPGIVPSEVFASVSHGYRVRRGFLEVVSVTAGRLLRTAPRLVAAAPVRMVYLTGGAQERIAEVAALPQLARLRGLSLSDNPIGDAGLRVLLSSPYLSGLRWLALANTGVTAAGIEELAASGALPRLRYVAADDALGLNPRLMFDYDGTLVHRADATLGPKLAARYDRPWLRWQPRSTDQAESEPQYDAV